MTHEEDAPGHTADPLIIAYLDTATLTHTTTDVTHHTGDPPLIEASPEITANQGPTWLTNIIAKHQPDHPITPDGQNGKQTTRITNRSPLMTHLLSITVLMNKTVTRRMI